MTKQLTRFALAIVLCTSLAAPAKAQTRAAGLHAGVSIASLTGDVSNTSTRTGVVAGGFWSNRVSEHWGFRLELNYVQKGGSGVVGSPVNEAVDLKLDYLELPLLVQVGTELGSSFVGAAQAGVSVGFNVLCDADFASEPGGYVACDDTTVGNRNVDLTVPLGVELGYRLPGGSFLSIEARYALGLTDVAKWDGPILEAVPLSSSPDSPSVRTSTFEALLRWTIPMGGSTVAR